MSKDVMFQKSENPQLYEVVKLRNLASCANNTKWNELRLAALNSSYKIYFRTKNVVTAHVSDWDAEWYMHFIEIPYVENEWVDLKVDNSNKQLLTGLLNKIGLEFQVITNQEIDFFRLYGYK